MEFSPIILNKINLQGNSMDSNNKSPENQIIQRISLEDTKDIVDNRKEYNIIIIDIRTPMEFQYGHIIDSINIDFYEHDFINNLNKLDKTKKYLIYCRHANRTSYALQMMRQLGFKYVLEMDMGITYWYQNGWELVY